MAQHTLSVLVENSPGVLARVAGLFSRRGYNIDSLAVGPTEDSDVSRITIVLNLEGHALDQVSAQLFKLVNVIGIEEMTEATSHQRELLFVKVSNSQREEILKVANDFGATLVDAGENSLIVEAVNTSQELEAMLTKLAPYGILELAQSGLIAMERGDITLVERTLSETGLASAADSSSQTQDYQN
jgi:acetolactate synthase-1/3 small subunit